MFAVRLSRNVTLKDSVRARKCDTVSCILASGLYVQRDLLPCGFLFFPRGPSVWSYVGALLKGLVSLSSCRFCYFPCSGVALRNTCRQVLIVRFVHVMVFLFFLPWLDFGGGDVRSTLPASASGHGEGCTTQSFETRAYNLGSFAMRCHLERGLSWYGRSKTRWRREDEE